jgi:hypothetical protein
MELQPNDAGTFRFHASESCFHMSGGIYCRGFGPSLSLSLPAQQNTNREKVKDTRNYVWTSMPARLQSDAQCLYVKRKGLLTSNCREAEMAVIFI